MNEWRDHVDSRGWSALKWLRLFGINADEFDDFNALLLALSASISKMERRVDGARKSESDTKAENVRLRDTLGKLVAEHKIAEQYLADSSAIDVRCPVCGLQFPDTLTGYIPPDRCNGIHLVRRLA